MALILRGLTIALPAGPLIQPFDLDIADGEVVTLMGPSGSGKSSLLAFIAGDLPDPLKGEGDVTVGGREVAHVPPERRRIGRLFQDDLLFPHLTAGENILFGMRREPRAARVSRMEAALSEAGLAGFSARPPHSLSGGQRGRVAVLRALLAEPAAMLLDEPFSKLDKPLRRDFREFVFNYLRASGTPSLLVTHDLSDAPDGGRIFVIDGDGRIRQEASQ